MKRFNDLTQDQQMMAFDQTKVGLVRILIQGKIVLDLIPFDKDITAIIDKCLKDDVDGVRAYPSDFLRNMEEFPNLKITFLHEVGKRIKLAAYRDDGFILGIYP